MKKSQGVSILRAAAAVDIACGIPTLDFGNLSELFHHEYNGQGFMVSFEMSDGSLLSSGHFPDRHAGEGLIKDKETAEKMADMFASVTKDRGYVNIYVIDHNFCPAYSYGKINMRSDYRKSWNPRLRTTQE